MIGPEDFAALLGAPPEPVAPDVRVLGEETDGTVRRLLLDYAVEPGERVEAFLLLPAGAVSGLPGILAVHPDGDQRPYAIGKSEPAGVGGDPELAIAAELALRGHAVLCPDRFPFESRSLERSAHAATFAGFRIFVEGPAGERLELTEDLYAGCVANRLLFQGRTILGRTLHELRRAVDVLSARPEVDPERLGVIGHSAGGLYAALTMFLDDRLRAGCTSCASACFRFIFGPGALRPINGFGSLPPPGMSLVGDIDDILAGLAPRPYLETVGDVGPSDPFFAETHAKALARYTELGIAHRYEALAYGAGHIFRRDMRERSYAWLERWLSPGSRPAPGR